MKIKQIIEQPAAAVSDEEPLYVDFVGQSSTQGMTLRDYFAASAMQGYLATFVEHAHPASFDGGQGVAELSYKLADAMLAEREKGSPHA